MVMKHYFEIVDARATREYWAINPLPLCSGNLLTALHLFRRASSHTCRLGLRLCRHPSALANA
jgi:hypothetical protein